MVRTGLRRYSAVLVLTLFGCGNEDHPPLIDQSTKHKHGTGGEMGPGRDQDGGSGGSTDGSGGTNSDSGGRRGGSGGRAGGSGGDGSGGAGSGGIGSGGADTVGPGTPTLMRPFDPAEIYLVGTLSEGLCGRGAIVGLSNPSEYAVGFTCEAGGGAIRDGEFLYATAPSVGNEPYLLRVFVPEPGGGTATNYPTDVLANDPIIPTGCTGLGIGRFLVSHSGRLIYRCAKPVWFDEDGTQIYDGADGDFLALTDDGEVVTTKGVMNLRDGVETNVGRLFGLITVRAQGSEFHFLLDSPYSDSGGLELWSVDGSGAVQRLGTYPPPPASVHEGGLGGAAKLTGDDSLISFGTEHASMYDVIVLRKLNGTSEVIYTEAEHPVKMHGGGWVITGP